MKQRNHISYLIAFSLFFCASSHCQELSAQLLAASSKVAALSKGLAMYLAITEAGLLAHELGHALTAKLLFNSPIDIRMGGIGEPIIKIPGFPISLGGYNPRLAFTILNLKIPPDLSYYDVRTLYLKLLAFYAAGPLTGILFHSIILRHTPYTKTALMGIADNLVALYPLSVGTDGSYIREYIKALHALPKHPIQNSSPTAGS